MKKAMLILICAVLSIALTACGNADNNSEAALNGLDYVLELSEEPIYDNVEIISEASVAGEAGSYEDLAENDLPYRKNLCFIAFEVESVYSEEEEIGIVGESRSSTLYKAHVYYDFLSDSECDYYINIYHAGDETSQYYGCPGYAVGHKYAAAVSGNETWVVANTKLEFSIYTINDVEFAYHHCAEEIKLSGDYVNLDLEMTDSEKSVITTTKNNPVLYTQKSTVKSLGSFIRDDWSSRGIAEDGNEAE